MPTKAPSSGAKGKKKAKRRRKGASSKRKKSSTKSTKAAEVAKASGASQLHDEDGKAESKRSVRIVVNEPTDSKPRVAGSTVFFDYPVAMYGETVQADRRKGSYLLERSRAPKLRFKFSSTVHEYNCVANALKRSGFVRTASTRLANLFWTNYLSQEGYEKLGKFQRVNHFPGSHGLGRKDNLARNISSLRRHVGARAGREFSFLPETYILPGEIDTFRRRAAVNPDQLWILKPSNASCGKGIRVITSKSKINRERDYVVCKYIMHPLLIDGRKFDMRIYVLITSFDPLRVYVFNDGLVRFATMKYSLKPSNTSKRYMHLTNYSVNKHSKHFVRNTDAGESGIGSKWSVRALREYLAKTGIDDVKVWDNIEGLIVKTLQAIEPKISANMRTYGLSRSNCFEVMGFDVLLDENLKPWLLEVNCSPSLSSSSPLDKYIKTQLMTDALHCVGVPTVDTKREWEKAKKRKRAHRSSLASRSGSSNHSRPPATDIQKLRAMGDQLDTKALSVHDRELIRETYDEQIRCGNFKVVYPTAANCKKYARCFQSSRYNNVLLEKWLALPKRDREAVVEHSEPSKSPGKSEAPAVQSVAEAKRRKVEALRSSLSKKIRRARQMLSRGGSSALPRAPSSERRARVSPARPSPPLGPRPVAAPAHSTQTPPIRPVQPHKNKYLKLPLRIPTYRLTAAAKSLVSSARRFPRRPQRHTVGMQRLHGNVRSPRVTATYSRYSLVQQR